MAKGASFAIYKSNGAAKFSMLPPRHNEKGYVERAGAIFLEVAPASGKQEWDWDKKIAFAIGVQDICNLIDTNLQSDEKRRRLFHDQSKNPGSSNNSVKTLEFEPGQWAGTFMMKVSEKDGDAWRNVTVPITDGEYKVIRGLLTQSVSTLLGWV